MILILQNQTAFLRPLTSSDLEFVEALDSDPRVTLHLPGAGDASRHERLAWLKSLHAPSQLEPWGFFALCLKDESSPMGWLHLRPEKDRPEFWDLGWRLMADYWGRGLATAAARRLVNHAVNQLGAACFSAQALSSNKASIRVMAKLGMKQESCFQWQDRLPAERWELILPSHEL